MAGQRKQLGEILIEAGLITPKTVERALDRQKESGKRLGVVLEDMGVITKEELLSALSRQLGLKTASNLCGYSFPKTLLALVPEDLAIQKCIFPLMEQQGQLVLAVNDPFDNDTLDCLAKKSGRRIIPVLATADDITAAIEKNYLGAQAAKSSKKKVLVVDDSQPVAAMLEVALQDDGFDAIVANDGLAGLKLAITHRPDLIVCDSIMPRMDGYGLMRAVRANPVTAGTPMILLTSKADGEDERRALESGFLDFIAKPVQPIRVVSRVRRAFELLDKMKAS